MGYIKNIINLVIVIGMLASFLYTPIKISADNGDSELEKLSFDIPNESNPRLDSYLNQLINSTNTSTEQDLNLHLSKSNGTEDWVRVVLECLPGQVDFVKDTIGSLGTIETSYEDLIQFLVPGKKLQTLAELAGVKFIRQPYEPLPGEVFNEGVSLVGADSWQNSGYTGEGVKIAILDSGFAGYSTLPAGELPDFITTWYTPGTNWPGNSVHGTACAEIIHDMAPNAQLYLVKCSTDVEFGNAVNWIISQGIDIVSFSAGWPVGGPGDGTGPICQIVDSAYAAGIMWVNSIGNFGQSHWKGSFVDSNGNGINEFSTQDEGNTISVVSGETIFAWLKWNDSWNSSNHDYALLLFDNTGNLINFSNRPQNGSSSPIEALSWVASSTGNYSIAIGTLEQPEPLSFDLYCSHNFQYATAAGSYAIPADSSNAIAVGAVPAGNPATLEVFSSQGPTADSRIKPDLVAVDGLSTNSYEMNGFWGTSASAPLIAGAAALIKQAVPSFSSSQITNYLKENALDLGIPGPDNLYGSGRVFLDEIPLPSEVTLTILVSGNGSTNPAIGAYQYSGGASVEITAIPAEGWQFTHWTGRVANTFSIQTTVIMNTDKTVRANFAPISPNSQKIVFVCSGIDRSEIYTIDANGSNRQRLTNNISEDLDPAWSPNKDKIAFSSNRDGNYEIYLMNAYGIDQTRITNNSVDDSRPTWSPGGTRIAFVSGDKIVIMNADGSGQTVISPQTAIDSYPDWSSDGSKIVFSSWESGKNDWDIYTMNIDGTNRKRILDTDLDDIAPAWSPDGSRIAFEGRNDIYIMNADGTNLSKIKWSNITSQEHCPDWSPDGSKIVFSSNYQLYCYYMDGTASTRLTNSQDYDNDPNWGMIDLSIIPEVTTNEASYLGAGSFRLNGTLASIGSNTAVDVSFEWGTSKGSYDNETPDQILTNPGNFSFDLSDLPAETTFYYRSKAIGTTVTYGQERQFFTTVKSLLISIEGNGRIIPDTGEYVYPQGSVIQISAKPAQGWQFDRWIGPVDNSNKDSTTITLNDGDCSIVARFIPKTLLSGKIAFYCAYPGNYGIYTMNSDGTSVVRLTDVATLDLEPAVSPDGALIAFITNRDKNRNELYVMNVDGSNPRRLTNNNSIEHAPAFSPDGEKIAFVSDSQIYCINIDGTHLRRITNNSNSEYAPKWSPDGSRIAFVSNRDGNQEIYVMHADGSEPVRLTNNNFDDYCPDWSPDGTRLVFGSRIDGIPGICVMNADGGDLVRLTSSLEIPDINPTWSPDGSKIAFISHPYKYGVQVMNADSSDRKSLSGSTLGDLGTDWFAVTTVAPEVFTGVPDNITDESVVLNGTLTNKGSSKFATGTFELRVADDPDAEIINVAPVFMTENGDYQATVTGLSPNTTYRFRAKAFGQGTNYGIYQEFTTKCQLSISTTGNGNVIVDPVRPYYELGDIVKITAVPLPGGSFTDWEGDYSGSQDSITLILDGNKTLTANFSQIKYTIIASAGTGGSITPSGQISVDYSGQVTFILAAELDYQIADIKIDNLSIGPVISYVFDNVTDNHTIAADFSLNPYTLSVSINGQGRVVKTPELNYYAAWTTVELTAIPDSGWLFENWTANANSPENPVTKLVMSRNQTVTANFIPENITGSKIVFIQGRDSHSEIALMNYDGSNPTLLTTNFSREYEPTLSPDGKKIAYNSDGAIFLMNCDGTDVVQLNLGPSLNAAVSDGGLSWSPDGNRLAFSGFPDCNWPEILVIDIRSLKITRLTDNSFMDAKPCWSPDGNRIAFISGENNNDQIFIINTDGSDLRQITSEPPEIDICRLDWSHDGQKIVYDTFNQQNYPAIMAGIYTINIDGTAKTQVVASGYWPSWSPDDTRIVYDTSNWGDSICTVALDGSNPLRLTDGSVMASHPSWGIGAWKNIPVTTGNIEYLSSNSVRFKGKLESLGGQDYVHVMFQVGTNPGQYTFETTSILLTSAMEFSCILDGLVPGTTYNYRAKAYGSGLGFGVEKAFSAGILSPTVGTKMADNVSAGAATLQGKLISLGSAQEVTVAFEYGTSATYGSTTPAQTMTENGDFSATVNGLIPDKVYHFRMIADGGVYGSTVGQDLLFCTPRNMTGSRIAFTSWRDGQTDIYIMNSDGTNTTRLTRDDKVEADSVLSPDGTMIAYMADTTQGRRNIFVMKADGTNPRCLTADSLYASGPVWSPDGTRIAFVTHIDNGSNRQIGVMNWDGSGLSILTSRPFHNFSPQWSPDGARLAFCSSQSGSNQIFVMNADGTAVVQLTRNSKNCHENTNPVWSPDGSRIAYVSNRNSFSYSTFSPEVYVMNADGSDEIRIAAHPNCSDKSPVWSPDGTKIAYVSMNNASNTLFIACSDGSGTLWGINNASRLVWSPDAAKLAYLRLSNIYTLDTNGTNLVQLTNSSTDGCFSWAAGQWSAPSNGNGGGGEGGGGTNGGNSSGNTGGSSSGSTVSPALPTSGLTPSLPIILGNDSRTISAAQLKTPDGKVTLDIGKATRLSDKSGGTLASISTTLLDTPPEPPPDSKVLVAYEMGPEGATFNPPLTLTFSFGPLPEGTKSVNLAFWNGTEWESIEATVDSVKGTATALVSHFSKYALLTQRLSPASIAVNSVTITPEKVSPNETVFIQAKVKNSGEMPGSFKAILKVNQNQLDSRELTLTGGKSETLLFQVNKFIPGEYYVDVNGITGKYTVQLPPATIAEISPTPALESVLVPAVTTVPTMTIESNSTQTPISTGTSNIPLVVKKTTTPLWWIVIGFIVVAGITIWVIFNQRGKRNLKM